jgi:4-hydroxy-3-methylbut-2-enyl diphosphate reductase
MGANLGRLAAAAVVIESCAGLQLGNVGTGARPSAATARWATPVMQQPATELTHQQQPVKREERRAIMGKEKYKRGGAPFEKSIHKDVTEKMSEKFKSQLVSDLKESDLREQVVGEGNAATTFVLAKEYGFCWGVERSIELAWAARDAYPEKKLHITNELIHNPGVNDMLADMSVSFIEKTEEGKRFDEVEEGDVVILPAFGASLEEMKYLDNRDVTVVDTTCPWVSKVWTTVDKHQRADMTSIIHGKWQHEEAIATASMCETYLIIKNMDEAAELASYILDEPGCLTTDELMAKYKHAMSPHFDPKKHLKKIGLANQTTMYKKETQAIGRLLEKTMISKYGAENIKENFAAFDTICDATQVRQDAITEMCESDSVKDLDFILVVGGWDSSNTAHLLEIPVDMGVTGYHVNVPGCIKPGNAIEHRTVEGDIVTTSDFLPLDRPARIGVTSGASTPDSVVQECLEAILLIKKVQSSE